MSRFLQIPTPIKSLFDGFPVKTYPALPNDDDAMSREFLRRKFPFEGPSQQSINSTFALGVYNVFREPNTNSILASDPWCLYAQFALCKKNSLRLPCDNLQHNDDTHEYRHCLEILSPFAVQDEMLPVLVEGYNKRFIRSTQGINEILTSRVDDDNEQLLYINMLDNVVYDCFITQLIFFLNDEQFQKLYSYQSRCSIKELKLTLVRRNQFHLRHKELVKNIESPFQHYQKDSLKYILTPIQKNCETTLLQFQDMLGKKPFISTNDSAPTYLELKIASYMLCIANLPEDTPFKIFVSEQCQHLMQHTQLALARLNHVTL